jgi:DNA-binding NtrC family response regulator
MAVLLFLDEIGEMPIDFRQNLFGTGNKGIYQNGRNEGFKSDFRLIAATNRNLEEEIKTGKLQRRSLFQTECF